MGDTRVHYARNGDVHLAYRVWGDREPTLLWIPGWVSNVSLWDEGTALFTPFLDDLVQRTRLVAWDKRGTGLSDPVTHVPALDERMDDLRAVMDAVGADCPAIFGISEGGPMSLLFAATYPERVRSMVLYGTLPRFTPDLPDFPWGFTPEEIAKHNEDIERNWGEGALADVFFGDLVREVPGFLELYAESQPKCASPRMAKMLWDSLSQIDVRPLLDTVRVPTLVLGRPGDLVAPVEAAQALAASIPNAEYLELPPGPHGLFDEAMAAAIVEFVCDNPGDSANERVLSTVLFTDIVGSTERLSAEGDVHWRHELDLHDRMIDGLLTKYGGRRAKHTGRRRIRAVRRPDEGGALRSGDDPRAGNARESASAPAFTSASVSGAEMNGAARRYTSERGSVRWPDQMRSWLVARCATFLPAPGCASTASGPSGSRESPRRPRFSASRAKQAPGPEDLMEGHFVAAVRELAGDEVELTPSLKSTTDFQQAANSADAVVMAAPSHDGTDKLPKPHGVMLDLT